MADNKTLELVQDEMSKVTLNGSEKQIEKESDNVSDSGVQKTQTEKDHINPIVEGELIKTLTKFFNEIDLVFDYVDKGIVAKLEKFLNSLKEPSNMKGFVEETVPILRDHETSISNVISKKR